jgi:thymidylate kinase
MSPVLISLSGIDGSGKTTISQLLARELRARGLPARDTRPRYDANGLIKQLCVRTFGDEYAYHPQLNPDFYIAALLIDWLQWGAELDLDQEVVLCCDRYELDVLAQAQQYGADTQPVRTVFASLPTPALQVFLDTPLDTGSIRLDQRPKGRHTLESDESLAALTAAFAQCLALADGNVTRIPSQGTPLDVVRQIADAVVGCT